jgi:hypothetical protein
MSWRTKVTDRGVPFGAIGMGLEGSFPSWGWGMHWFWCLRKWLSTIKPVERKSIDFLMPNFSVDGHTLSAEPITYATAVTRLRFMLDRLKVDCPGTYTAHSAKATLLAWSAQLSVDTSKRARQGHHQTEKTVTLYGRDDVFAALQLQEEVLRKVRSGWRPLRAQQRGALPPAPEAEVSLRGGRLDEKEFTAHFRAEFVPPCGDSLKDLQYCESDGVSVCPCFFLQGAPS